MLRSANKAPVESEKTAQQPETPYDASTATRRENFKEAPQKPPAPRPTGIAASPRVNPPVQQPELAGPPVGAMNPPMSQVQSELAKIANMDPAEIEAQRRKQYESEVGKPQFQEERELIKELQTRRANIGKGTNPLMDLLEGIATSAPGRGGILSQGAEGVRNARAMQQQREQQNMDMLKEILGQQKTITTGERAYKENLFALGKKVYDETFTQRFDALKAQGVDERDARRLASEEARAEMQYAVNYHEQYAKIQAMKNPVAAERKDLAGYNMLLKSYLDELQGFPKPDRAEFLRKEIQNVQNQIKVASGISGAPSDIPSINNNDDYNKLKPGQQYRDPQGNLRTKG
jgi:hypothetical protein